MRDPVSAIIGLSLIFFVALFFYIIGLIFKAIFKKRPEKPPDNIIKDNNLLNNNNRITLEKKSGYAVYDSITKCPHCAKEYPILNCHINKKTFCKNCNNFFIIKGEN
ncbi:MAG: hypothetical protein LBD41_06295 [Clostridiales Family XIII bacterium]|jgi:hypothetical protein|nr:hypothetical protein [Clostridiales Family XIII bacterium]